MGDCRFDRQVRELRHSEIRRVERIRGRRMEVSRQDGLQFYRYRENQGALRYHQTTESKHLVLGKRVQIFSYYLEVRTIFEQLDRKLGSMFRRKLNCELKNCELCRCRIICFNAQVWYNREDFYAMWNVFLKARYGRGNSTLYKHDVVDITRQALQLMADNIYANIIDSYKTKNITAFR